MSTVGVDLRILPADGSPGAGIAHAARELTEALFSRTAKFDIDLYAILPQGAKTSFPESSTIRTADASGRSLRKVLREYPLDRLFVPGGAVAPFLPIPSIPWVHDLAIFDHPEWFPQGELKRFFTTRAFAHGLRKAPRIFAVSEHTKQSIVERIGIPEEKIFVTYEGVTVPENIDFIPRVFEPTQRYVLSLGTLEPRKNIAFAAKAFLDANIEGKYVIAGRTGWGSVALPNSSKIIRMEEVTDAEKWALLRDAEALLLPSLHEGFGRTALEAMAVGTLVIASEAGAISEVVGDQGLLLYPSESSAWEKALEAVFRKPGDFDRMRAGAKTRAVMFDWDRIADLVLASMQGSC